MRGHEFDALIILLQNNPLNEVIGKNIGTNFVGENGAD